MPIIKSEYIVVFDFETWSLDTARCEVVQVACLAMDYRSLKVVPGSEFSSYIKPLDRDNFDQRAIDVNGITHAKVEDAPELEAVWGRFAEHVYRYNPRGKSPFTAPIPAGKNILKFDMPIYERLARKYKTTDSGGKPNLFHERIDFDVEADLRRWFGHTDEMENLKMDTLRKYLGLPKEGAHDALVDVRQTAMLLASFHGLYRKSGKRVKFKDAYAKAA